MTGKASVEYQQFELFFLSMVKNKVVLKKAGLDFWEGVERNPIDFHSHVHKTHLSNLGRRNDSARAKKFKA